MLNHLHDRRPTTNTIPRNVCDINAATARQTRRLQSVQLPKNENPLNRQFVYAMSMGITAVWYQWRGFEGDYSVC